MYSFSVPMALVDYLPVLFFGCTMVLLQKNLYGQMSRTSFSLFSAGTLNVFAAGFLKATWKLLYALGLCNFEALNTLFLPLQSIGFLLLGIGILGVLRKPQSKALAVEPPLFSGTFLFIGMMVLGLGTLCGLLSALAAKRKRHPLIALFVLSFVASLCMGYLSSRDSHEAWVNWAEQGINCLSQGALLAGTYLLHRAGLSERV